MGSAVAGAAINNPPLYQLSYTTVLAPEARPLEAGEATTASF